VFGRRRRHGELTPRRRLAVTTRTLVVDRGPARPSPTSRKFPLDDFAEAIDHVSRMPAKHARGTPTAALRRDLIGAVEKSEARALNMSL
jgi:hypothetical protein